MNERLGMALVGPGFIAEHHLDAVRRLGDVTIVGILGSSEASGRKRAAELGVDRTYSSLQELLADDNVQVVHNTTPNDQHLRVSRMALEAGKHVISDKPLARNGEECRQLRDVAARSANIAAVTYNYRGYALVQHMRAMIRAGDVGPVTFVHGHYLQDWLADDHTYTWRLDPERGGSTSALGDIGSHWCDLAEHVTGARITHVMAELATVIPTRFVSDRPGTSFAAADGAIRPIAVTSEDLATAMVRFSNGARGVFTVAQVLPGHKNDLLLEVNGRNASLRWRQEEPNALWIGRANAANEALSCTPQVLHPEAASYARTPGGHTQGWSDAFLNVIADAYHAVRDHAARPATLCTFADAGHIGCVIEAMLESFANRSQWITVKDA